VIAREHDGHGADAGLTVELCIDDAELADRVREMLMHDPGIHIVSRGGLHADIRITDEAAGPGSGSPVLVFCTGAEALGALQAGASAVLPEDATADALRSAIRAAADGLIVLTDDVRDRWLARSDLDGLAQADEDEPAAAELTERELQVLALLAEGASNKSIARSLAITPHTAKFHVASIVAKLGASGRTEAVAKAMRLGLFMI
jgi:DNA-binding NarL/FixJ family response regulator